MDDRPLVNSFWLGERLGAMSAACLASFVRHGHRVILYCYEALRDAPRGVELADAAQILPKDRIMRHRVSGSFAIFADLFRYELLRRGAGMWIDCDLYCVRPFVFSGDHVFGRESADSVCNAALLLPADSPVLAGLIEPFGQVSPIPAWLPERVRGELQTAKAAGARFDMSHLPWGASGPTALTYLLREYGLLGRALPPATFYPLPHAEADRLLAPGFDLASVISAETYAVHLWNQSTGRKLQSAPPHSPLGRLLSQGTPFDDPLLDGAAVSA